MQDDIHNALINYLETCYVRRDLQATLKLFSTHVTGFGSGPGENAFDLARVTRLVEQDIAENPQPAQYKLTNLFIQPLPPSFGLAACELDLKTAGRDGQPVFNHHRLSILFSRKLGSGLLVEHLHISSPSGPSAVIQSPSGPDANTPRENNPAQQRLLEEKTRALNEALEQIKRLEVTDRLTGVFNRSRLDEALETELRRCERYSTPLTVILVDLDNFKMINDIYGHLAGDQALVGIAALINSHIRKTDIVGRWGGEEFLVICPQTVVDGGLVLAEKLRSSLAAHNFPEIGCITASFGVTTYSAGDSRDGMITRADIALASAKRAGKDRVGMR